MDNNLTSLSLALENHELSNRKYQSSPTQLPVPTSPTNENANCRFDASCLNQQYCENNFNEVEDDYDSYEKLSYETAQRLFAQISHKDSSVRRAGLDILSRSIFQWIHNADSDHLFNDDTPEILKNINSGQLQTAQVCLEVNGKQDEQVCSKIVKQALASLLRLSIRCPFQEVRSECSQILSELQDENVDVPSVRKGNVSRFVPNSQINPVDTDDDQTYTLYEESFIHNCRLEHMVMVMALHPQYLQQFLDTNFHLLQSKGALPFQYRSYIAIMAAARHRCTYLVHLMEAHFLLQGGDREWLRGIDHVPAKLRALSTLNKLLAHRPWLVTPAHIKELVDGETSSRWQHPELAQAIVLLCHFHGLAVFCHGSGINLEIDHETAHVFHNKSTKSAPSSPNSSPSSGTTSPNYGRVSPIIDNLGAEHTGDVEVLMERMKRLREEEEEVTREEMNRRFEKEKDEASHSLIPGTVSPVDGATSFARYVVDPGYSYQEFAKRDVAAEIPTFREQDYTWGDHACLVVRKFYSDVADLLDVKFNIAQTLTYKTLASKDNVDTSSLRRAVWMYVHCMYGIMYDDYNYGEVNQLLERPLKVFIKTASCFPEKTNRKLYDGFWKQFRHSEKIHVTIMIMESRLQVGLLYGMRALTEYLRDS